MVYCQQGGVSVLYEEKDLALSLLNVFTFSRSDSVVQERPRNFHALSIRTGGSGRFEYDNRSFSVNRGEIVYVPAGRGYRVSAEYEEIIVLHFQLWNYRSLEIQPFVPADSAACEALFRRILAEWERRRAGSGYRCTAMAYELLAQLQIQAAEARCAEGALRKIRPSMECLERRLLDPELTVEDLAACSAMSSVYFRHLFREAFQTTPRAYLTSLRMGRAKELLASGYYSVAEIAEQSGFPDAKYFSTAFRKVVGMTPRQFADSQR